MLERKKLSRSRRNACWILVILFTATLAIGAATHGRTTVLGGALGGAPGGGLAVGTARDGAISVRGTLDRTAVLMGDDGLVRMELVLRARSGGNDALTQPLPTDLVVVLDRSGSMNGQKIRDAQAAIHHLISRLGPEDRFSLVAFSSGAEIAIPLARATPSARAAWSRIVDGIHAGGGTYMSTGLTLGLTTLEAARSAGHSPRAIVISDGLAAEPHDVLRSQAARATAGEYTLSAVGVGADFDESLMSALADAGTGNYYYLEDANQLARVFSAEFETARETVATGVAVTVAPTDGIAVVDAAGYPLERSGRTATFRPGTLFAGQERHVWITLRVPTDAAIERELGAVRVQYHERGERQQLTLEDFPKIACVQEKGRFFANLDTDAWAKSVVVEEYNQLRQSVAGLVKEGYEAEALAEIKRFKDRNRAMNEVVASPRVATQLDEADDLESAVAGAFRGPGKKQKQNLLGKSLHAQGTLDRREGSRK
jgi:Ca-activated chloride channel family protein